MRAHFTLHSDQIQKHLFIIVAKPQILNQSFKEREKQFLNALKRIKVLKNS